MKIIKIDNNHAAIEGNFCCDKFIHNLRDEVIYYLLDSNEHKGFYIIVKHPSIMAIKITYCPFCGKLLENINIEDKLNVNGISGVHDIYITQRINQDEDK